MTNRRIGALFAIGATCFAVASLPLYAARVVPWVVGATFFVGSIFFTTAAGLQFRQAAAGLAPSGGGTVGGLRAHLVGLGRRPGDWWAGLIQFVGTVAFNVSTFVAIDPHLEIEAEVRLVWTPDVVGSVCFLVASGLAYAAVSRAVRTGDWWIAVANLAGSVAFGISAAGAWVLPTTGQPVSVLAVNAGTFTGAVCFFIGALLLRRCPDPAGLANPS